MKPACFVLALVGLSAISGASLKSEIDAFNKPINAALKNRDIEGFKRIVKGGVTSDFKYQDDGGKPMNFDSMVEGMRMGLAMYKKITKVTNHVISVKEAGKTGSAVETQIMEGVISSPDKKVHKMVFVGTSVETYRKVGGKWKMATMSMKTDKMTMDGKPMPMGGGH